METVRSLKSTLSSKIQKMYDKVFGLQFAGNRASLEKKVKMVNKQSFDIIRTQLQQIDMNVLYSVAHGLKLPAQTFIKPEIDTGSASGTDHSIMNINLTPNKKARH